MASKHPRKGDYFTWQFYGGTAEGEVKREITASTTAGGRKGNASKADPQFLLKSDKSGGEAVYKPQALHKK